jgi:hypothetical protein
VVAFEAEYDRMIARDRENTRLIRKLSNKGPKTKWHRQRRVA